MGGDRVDSGPHHDTVYGEPGKDTMLGGDGIHLLSGDLGPDDHGNGEAGFDFCPPSTENPVSCV